MFAVLESNQFDPSVDAEPVLRWFGGTVCPIGLFVLLWSLPNYFR